MWVDSNSGVLSIKSVLCQTWLVCFLCLCELGQSTEYNWFANLRFKGRIDNGKEDIAEKVPIEITPRIMASIPETMRYPQITMRFR